MTTEFWRAGWWPAPITELGRICQGFEDAGWDGFCVGEAAATGPDPFICHALAAAATTRLKLGTGVLVPMREPIQAANAIATIHAVSNERTMVSFGRGDGAYRALGRVGLTVDQFATYVRRVQAYLRREEVDLDGFASTLGRLFAVDRAFDVGKPPIDVTATGPRMMEVAALEADSVTFEVGADPMRVRDCVEYVRKTRQSAGLDPEGIRVGCYIIAGVTDGSDRSAIRDLIRPVVMQHAAFSAYHGTPVGGSTADHDVYRRAAAEYRGPSTDHFRIGDASVVIDDAFVDRFTVIGTADECAEKIQPLIDVGLDRIVVLATGKWGQYIATGEDNSTRFAQQVLPLVR